MMTANQLKEKRSFSPSGKLSRRLTGRGASAYYSPPLSSRSLRPLSTDEGFGGVPSPPQSSYRSPRPLSDILGQGQVQVIYFVLSQPTKLNRPTKNAPVRTPVKAFAVKFSNTTDSGPIVKNSTAAVNKSSM